MTQPNNSAWDLGGGGDSFQFESIGDEIEGYVQSMEERQGNDMQTGEPAWWDKEQTRPVMITVVTLQTTLREYPNDKGIRTVTLSGSKKVNPDGGKSKLCAARNAVKGATGGTAMEFNAWFKMKWVGEGPRTKPGFTPPRYWDAWYKPPTMDLDRGQQGAPQTGYTNYNQAASGPGSNAPGGNEWAPQQNQPAPGANWPAQQPAQQQPAQNDWRAQQAAFAQQQQSQPGQQPANAAAGAATITVAQIESLRAAGVDPALVYGADWANRVTP